MQQPAPPDAAARLLAAGAGQQPVHLVLARDRARSLKQGHPWVYADSLQERPPAPAGSLALVKNKAGDILAKGLYDPNSQLAFRAVAVKERRLDDDLIERRLARALDLRQRLFSSSSSGSSSGGKGSSSRGGTTGYRLINGEGDGLPGLVCDVYGSTAVMKLDGAGPTGFYDAEGVAQWVARQLQLDAVFLKFRSGSDSRGRPLLGPTPARPVAFVENGLGFAADVVQGQKTGFFLDQRDNRRRLQAFARGARVLNLFSYTGGFSVYAGAAGASSVTSVDVAAAAIQAASDNWALNGLEPGRHIGVAADVFDYLQQAAAAKERWEVVVVDPPSFAPNKAAVPKARQAYERLFEAATRVTASGGVLALASCSSHIDAAAFQEICEAAIQKARRTAAVLGVHGQPADHPFPMACPELRYLKLNVYALD